MPNIVYILTNEAMPNLVKIGRTDAEDVRERMSSLNNPSVPYPFECHFAAEVDDGSRVEKALHRFFSKERVNPSREFFKVEPEKVVLALRITNFKDVTPRVQEIVKVGQNDNDEKKALDKAKARRPNIRLEPLGINIGDVLTFSRDETITAIVVKNNKINYCEETLSLSSAAEKALGSQCGVSGSLYWKFEGELLDDRRQRIESEQFDDSTGDLD
jgi:hypothetical protein